MSYNLTFSAGTSAGPAPTSVSDPPLHHHQKAIKTYQVCNWVTISRTSDDTAINF